MKNKKLKKLDESYTQILLEKMSSDLKFVAEQHVTTAQKIDAIKEVQDGLVEDVVVIKSVVQSHSKDIKELQAGHARLEAGYNELSKDVKELKDGQMRIEEKLDLKLDNHEKRILKLEETAVSR